MKKINDVNNRKKLVVNLQRNLVYIGKTTFLKIHFFQIHANFEAENEIDNSDKGDGTTIIHKQHAVFKG